MATMRDGAPSSAAKLPYDTLVTALKEADVKMAEQQREIANLERQLQDVKRSTVPRNKYDAVKLQLEQANLTFQRQGASRRHDSLDHLCGFIEHQANQRAYEASFLKTFIMKALDTRKRKLEDLVNDGGALAKLDLEGYLREVVKNVDQLTDKMIWNAHHTFMNLTTKGFDPTPLLDVRKFNAIGLFDDFEPPPGLAHSVVDSMSTNWVGRVTSSNDFVMYTKDDYPIEGRPPLMYPLHQTEVLRWLKGNAGIQRGIAFEKPNIQLDEDGSIARSTGFAWRPAFERANTPRSALSINEVNSVDNDIDHPALLAPPRPRQSNARRGGLSVDSVSKLDGTGPVSPSLVHTVQSPTSRPAVHDDGNHLDVKTIQPRGYHSTSYSLGKQSPLDYGQGPVLGADIFGGEDDAPTAVGNLIGMGGGEPHPNGVNGKDTPSDDIAGDLGPVITYFQGDETRPHSSTALANRSIWQDGLRQHDPRWRLLQNHQRKLAEKYPPRWSEATTKQPQHYLEVIDAATKQGITMPPSPEIQRQIDAHFRKRKKKALKSSWNAMTEPDLQNEPDLYNPHRTPKESFLGREPATRAETGSEKPGAPATAKAGLHMTVATRTLPGKSNHRPISKADLVKLEGARLTQLEAVHCTPNAMRTGTSGRPQKMVVSRAEGRSQTMKAREMVPTGFVQADNTRFWTTKVEVVEKGYPRRTVESKIPKRNLKVITETRGRHMEMAEVTMNGLTKGTMTLGTGQIPQPGGALASNLKQRSAKGTSRRASERINVIKMSTRSNLPVIPKDPNHPSGSKTLAVGQVFPEGAYFDPKLDNEKKAYRCGVPHALGYYYIAGDRNSCRGCNTARSDNSKLEEMDFYLPAGTICWQPAPEGVIWTPGCIHKKSKKPVLRVTEPKESKKRQKRHKTILPTAPAACHNGIAKIEYWAAIDSGLGPDDARKRAVELLNKHLTAVKDAKVEAERERDCRKNPPLREPSPVVDLPPHPSGSKVLEPGQKLPEGSYWKPLNGNDQLAWRCDIAHALGRYYMAGNKGNCPGCGSCKSSRSKRTEMDFYMRKDTQQWQEAPKLVNWKPRKPHKMTKNKKRYTRSYLTHNQQVSRNYFEAIEDGLDHESALVYAIDVLGKFIQRHYAFPVKEEPEVGQSESEDSTATDGDDNPALDDKEHQDESNNKSVNESLAQNDHEGDVEAYNLSEDLRNDAAGDAIGRASNNERQAQSDTVVYPPTVGNKRSSAAVDSDNSDDEKQRRAKRPTRGGKRLSGLIDLDEALNEYEQCYGKPLSNLRRHAASVGGKHN